uniref:Uncharacterized protein n=1 Tax=Rhinopithecus bieti TaxID=61621 RepID=A0A2K6LV42_RHIBE
MTWHHLQTASIILHPALDWCPGHTALLLTHVLCAGGSYTEQTRPGPPWTASLLSVQLRSTSETPSRDSHPRHLAFSASLLIPTMPNWIRSPPCLFLEVVSSAGAAALSRMQPCSSVTHTWTHSIIVIERGSCQLKEDEVINLERSTLLLTRCGLSVAVLTGWEAQPLVGSWKQTLPGRED